MSNIDLITATDHSAKLPVKKKGKQFEPPSQENGKLIRIANAGTQGITYRYLLKTELRISDFQHFHWLAGHRLSAHIPALPNMANERVSK